MQKDKPFSYVDMTPPQEKVTRSIWCGRTTARIKQLSRLIYRNTSAKTAALLLLLAEFVERNNRKHVSTRAPAPNFWIVHIFAHNISSWGAEEFVFVFQAEYNLPLLLQKPSFAIGLKEIHRYYIVFI